MNNCCFSSCFSPWKEICVWDGRVKKVPYMGSFFCVLHITFSVKKICRILFPIIFIKEDKILFVEYIICRVSVEY